MFKKLNKIRCFFLYALTPILFMANFPRIVLSNDGMMNYELTLPMVWLVLFFFISLPVFVVNFKKFITNKKVLIFSMIPVYATISLFWTDNFLRGFLTVGLLWLIFFAIISMVDFIINSDQQDYAKFKKRILKIFFITSLVVCGICWLQCILDIAGVDHSFTSLCAVCTYKIFGFPHPNGLAIEPQYMGNLLLAPALLSFYLFNKKNGKLKRQYFIIVIISVSTLFLTLSRGAIFSFGLACILMLIALFVKECSLKKILQDILVLFISFSFAIISQGVFAELSPTTDSFFTGVSKYTNHLSLGIIDLQKIFCRDLDKTNEGDYVITEADDDVSIVESVDREESDFDGYIEASTDIRKSLTAFSLDLWKNNPLNLFFGVGYGGAGVALAEAYEKDIFSQELYSQYPTWIINDLFSTPKQIVQNEYAEILLELGLVGFILVFLNILMIVQYFLKDKNNIFIYGLFIAYFASFFFLSGFTNVFHAYLLPAFLTRNKTIVRGERRNWTYGEKVVKYREEYYKLN